MLHHPPAPDQNNVRTYYENARLDRLTGHYTVAWENAEGPHRIRVHARLTDMEGYRPSLYSLMRLPKVVKSYLESKKSLVLKDPVPFLVMDAIRFLDKIVQPGMRVLEVGGGNSTLWFLKKGAEVTTIEHSREWATHVGKFAEEQLGPEVAGRLRLHVEQGEAAVERIAAQPDEHFDLVLVDCMNEFTWRRPCVAAGRGKIEPGGWMVLDNSDHPNNWAAAELMNDRQRIRFTGLAPMCSVVSQTSFWQM